MHEDETYNGRYINGSELDREDSGESYNGRLINGCPWYLKTAPDGSVRVLYFYDQNSGGGKGWSLIPRLWDGQSDWSR